VVRGDAVCASPNVAVSGVGLLHEHSDPVPVTVLAVKVASDTCSSELASTMTVDSVADNYLAADLRNDSAHLQNCTLRHQVLTWSIDTTLTIHRCTSAQPLSRRDQVLIQRDLNAAPWEGA
jgi:hypothetical protein